jgi:hypothetical protein
LSMAPALPRVDHRISGAARLRPAPGARGRSVPLPRRSRARGCPSSRRGIRPAHKRPRLGSNGAATPGRTVATSIHSCLAWDGRARLARRSPPQRRRAPDACPRALRQSPSIT